MTARVAFLLALITALFAPAAAGAATFAVTTTADGNATCTAVQCTLRAAIAAAGGNGNLEDDVIDLPLGTYATNPQFGGDLTVPANATRITIRGRGANGTFIQPLTTGRVLTVATGAGVTLTDLTLRNGLVTPGFGGNVLAASTAALTLTRVRITNGSAQRGGGIATQGAASLTVSASLIDTNVATAATTADVGGGIYVEGQTAATAVTIQDSTITANRAANGGGIGVLNNTGQPPTLRGVTLAANVARGQAPGGLYAAATNARIQGSIIAGNTGTINLGNQSVAVPFNCALATAAVDEGGSVETGTDCGLPAAGRQNTDPQLAGALDGSQPPALAIPATSPAVDLAACGARTADQRGVARPQGTACDAGAYEYQAPVVEPTPTPTATATATATATPTATPTPTPTPVFNRSTVVRKISGTVLVRRPGSSRFVALEGVESVAFGSTVDVKRGRIELTSLSRRGAAAQKATFYAGIFKLAQVGDFTELRLSEALSCPAKGKASAAASKPKTRKLWGDGKGKFRTRGTYSAATVRGTKWLVRDSCTNTLTRVTAGVVAVRDSVLKKTIIVRKGKRYIARARR